ncbi:hypothetical protein RB594_006145 [Gaeumannomyces avenae]
MAPPTVPSTAPDEELQMQTPTPHADQPATALNDPDPLTTPAVLGQEFTDHVIASIGPGTSPRLREVMTALVRHVHDFAREIRLTQDEWLAAVDLINRAGRMSDGKRNEGQLLCDIIGLESLVDNMAYQSATAAGSTGPTESAILGPFWRADAPARPNGSSITFDTPADGTVVFMHGVVSCSKTGRPIPGASVDAWQASTNGLYEQQDPNQRDHNLRGVFTTDKQGRYSFYCLRPTPYPVCHHLIPTRFQQLQFSILALTLLVLDSRRRACWRTAENARPAPMASRPYPPPCKSIYVLLTRVLQRLTWLSLSSTQVQAGGFKSITTQIFDKESGYLDDDAVFAVKDGLTVQFKERHGDAQAELELEYNIRLAPLGIDV